MIFKSTKLKSTIALMLIMILSIGLVGCGSSKESSAEIDGAKKVIEEYFGFMAAKDTENIFSTLTEHWKESDVNWDFENLESIAIEDINEEVETYFIDEYMKVGRGKDNGVDKENVKVLRVKYSIDYKVNKDGYNDGIFDRWFFVIRKDQNSPWLIDDFTL